MDLSDLARRLRSEAEATDERRLLALAGAPGRGRDAALDALDAAGIDAAGVPCVGTLDAGSAPWEVIEPRRAGDLMGTTHGAVVVDAHGEFRPNALGQAVGAVDGGGLLLLVVPPLDAWPDRRDGFDESLAVPPFGVGDVTGHFRERTADLLLAHPGVAVVDVDAGAVRRDGLTHPAPRRPDDPPAVPDDPAFPRAAYEACRTDDQVAAVEALEQLREGGAVVVEADRGRGKSSAAGLAAGSLALAGRDVLVTAPQYRNAAEVFARARALLDAAGDLAGTDHPDTPRRLDAAGGSVRYERPPAAADAVADGWPDAVIVDEAAALPVRVLERFLDAPAVAFATTVHGYEGAGRGFSVRFRERLDDSGHPVTECRLDDPIRYAAGDPVEVWAFRTLLLDARPAADPLVADATPETVAYRRLSSADLLTDEHRLREAFGLLVLAHYRTEPNDLARLLDAPNVAVRALTHDGHVASVALLAREGGLPADLRASMYEGSRVRGNMIPDVLTSQLRDEAAGVPVGQRVMRIATHHAVRGRGLGSALLDRVRAEFADEVDWLGTGYGATPGLLSFWGGNGYRTVHLSTTRNDASGEHSAVMLNPTSERGDALLARHARWFRERLAGVLSDPLADLDPDVVRAALRTVPAGEGPALTDWEWRLVAGSSHGASIFDTAPGPFRRLALAHLLDPPEPNPLSPREERLLVRKPLQGHPWDDVAADLGFHSTAECMRALGAAVDPLVSRFGGPIAADERTRYE